MLRTLFKLLLILFKFDGDAEPKQIEMCKH